MHSIYWIVLSAWLLISGSRAENAVFESSTNICERCKCQTHLGTFYMDCVGQQMNNTLANWPTEAAGANITRINANFNHNGIRHLEALPATDSELLVSYARNAISALDDSLLINCANISSLDLSYNRIRSEQLVSRVFKGRYNDTAFEPVALRRLSLAFNELHTINKNAFEHLVHLRWLDLSGNRFRILDQLTALSFRNLPSLQYMDLSDNELIFLNTSCFVGLNNLQVLDLSNNALDFIPVTIKDVAGTLRILKIDNNPIVEISEDSLLGMEALEEFQASNLSQIEEIKTNSFTTLKRLRRVDLSHIGSKGVIYNQAFGDSLREMNLSNSNMEILSDELVNWSRLTVLDLRGNQLYCTCVLYNISTQLSAEVKRDADAPYCFDYKRYKQYKMYELSEDICREQDEYLNLSGGMYSTERIMRMVLLSTSVLLIICVCIAVWLGYVRCYKNQRSYPFSTAVLYNPVSN